METKEKNTGAIIGVIIIVIILIAGAWYFIGGRVNKIEEQKKNINTEVVNTETFSTSTEITDIQADLGKIDIKVLDQQ